jgi:hypothetical protein
MNLRPINPYPHWAFVGLGGTFYGFLPYLGTLLANWKPPRVHLVDHDCLREENLARQWSLHGYYLPRPSDRTPSNPEEEILPLMAKASLARTILTPANPSTEFLSYVEKFPPLHLHLGDQPLLLVVNVDNDEARLAARKWCLERKGHTTMVVSGCDMAVEGGEARGNGQAYYGEYGDTVQPHDWHRRHPDVGDADPPEHPLCGGQTIMANALTGTLVGVAMEKVLQDNQHPRAPGGPVEEYYWNVAPQEPLNSWTCVLLARKPAVYQGRGVDPGEEVGTG